MPSRLTTTLGVSGDHPLLIGQDDRRDGTTGRRDGEMHMRGVNVNGDSEERPSGGAQPAGRRDAPAPGGARRQSRGANKKLTNGLVALSSAAVLAVYGVGYARTAPAADAAGTVVPTAAVVSAAATSSPTATATTAPAMTAATASSATTGVAAVPPTLTPAPTSTAPALAPTATTPAPTATTAAAAAQASSAYRDGTYVGTGTSRHGSIEATVVVQGGKIVSAQVTGCGTRYPCSRIAALPGQVITRQSAAVDFVSGATDSSIAYRGAVANALAQAR
jgi:uncharacterized protein with FMN-binding domain